MIVDALKWRRTKCFVYLGGVLFVIWFTWLIASRILSRMQDQVGDGCNLTPMVLVCPVNQLS